MKLEWSSFTFGRDEDGNQDALLEPLLAGNAYWMAIADGVGGRPGGGVASAIAIATILDLVKSDTQVGMPCIFDAIRQAFSEKEESFIRLRGMATTLSIINIEGDSASVGHVGDSRVYHLRGQGIVTRTKDQTELQDLIDRGIINKRQSKRYRRKNVITNFLSSQVISDPYFADFDVQTGDRILLVTDGVYEMLSRQEIRDISRDSDNVSALAARLHESVKSAGAIDDYSAVVIERVE